MRMPARSHSSLRHLVALLALLLAVGVTRPAFADDPRTEAKGHYQAGLKAYGGGDYQAAIREFTAAQALAPADLNNYNLALCYDKLGDGDNAIKFYRAYLDRVPTADKRPEIEASIARLQQSRAPAPTPVPVAPPIPAAPAPAAPIAPAPPPSSGPAMGATGDPQMDRVNRVDIGAMRDQRMGAGPDAGGPPPPRDVNNVGQPYANQGPPPQGVGTAPTQQPAPGTQADVKPADPVYKKWWFWAVVGVSAYVVYSIATEKSSSDNIASRNADTSLRFGKSARGPGPSGLTLFSW